MEGAIEILERVRDEMRENDVNGWPNAIDYALAALRNPWRGIEECPRDGSVVLAWRYYPVAIQWAPEIDPEFPWNAIQLGGAMPLSDNGFSEGDPALTHYMPPPPAPEQP